MGTEREFDFTDTDHQGDALAPLVAEVRNLRADVAALADAVADVKGDTGQTVTMVAGVVSFADDLHERLKPMLSGGNPMAMLGTLMRGNG